ncbi:hypothetical protein [Nocardioides marmorisolisilvae]|uniref:Uncharacterized protein n=1 Tax=Nocardioides marmorisolisilvae TaxID=1542737 RepID=A0A3N0DTK1_9ACTN|nr:hypothetical protein [Nocardioides marmorisolisilvae]RNL78816.1 hypothetical protein EFL95_07050 [Nocardioides marmorisolisilvae]
MSTEPNGRLWHVTLTVAGEPVEPMLLRAALSRLRDERPFIDSVEYTGGSACLDYWDEGPAMLDVASLALRLWPEHRESAGLPSWEIVGLEVVEKSVREARSGVRAAATSLTFQL